MQYSPVLALLLVFCYDVTADNNTQAAVPKPRVLHLHVHTDIKVRYAKTVVNTKYVNVANISQEVAFNAILPETAFISEFQILVDGQIYNAHVREKEAARKEYEEAVQQGRTAAHVTMNARDSQRFTVSMNVEPEKKVTFILTYEELLNRRLGLYRHVLNLDPGEVLQDFSVVVRIKEFSNITKLNVPALLMSNEMNDTGSTNPLATIERPAPETAVVRFAPSPEQQRELAAEGIKGQLMIEYDVDRSHLSGEVLMNDGYFVHFFAPDELPPLRKHVTFVLDVSGSMSGRKMQQLKQAMKAILKELNQTDLFSIVVFSSTVQVWDYNLTRAMQAERLGRLQGMRWGDYDEGEEEIEARNRHVIASATPENITSAEDFINDLTPVGATNINDALLKGLEISKLALSRHNTSAPPVENNDLNQSEQQPGLQTPQPILVFLTDGKANVGVSNKFSIISNVGRVNTVNCSVFGLALGSEPDFDFLKKLSLRNFGFARKIYEASDTALQLREFYRQVSTPLMTQVSFSYLPQQVVRNTLTKLRHRLLFSGSELVVAGKVRADSFSGEVRGVTRNGTAVYPVSGSPLENSNATAGFMERLWAYLTIQQLLEVKETSADNDTSTENSSGEVNENNQTALDLALRYSFVTPLTSLVVVKPNETETKPVETEDASEPGVEFRSSGVIAGSQIRSSSPRSKPSTFTSAGAATRSRLPDNLDLVLANINDVTWLAGVTSNNTVTLQTAGNETQTLQLAGDEQSNTEHAACTPPGREQSHCRHFRFCVLTAFTASLQDFLPYLCRIDNYLGVCCPDYLQSP